MGTIFCLRYEVCGRRKWETLTGSMITLKYASARAKMRESDLLTGAINDAKAAPVVPAAAEPEKPARLTVDRLTRRLTGTCGTHEKILIALIGQISRLIAAKLAKLRQSSFSSETRNHLASTSPW
jgi:hypothetical protein